MTLVPDAKLARLLQDLYDPEALRRFLRSHEAYRSLDTELPGSQVSALHLSDATVHLLRQHGLIDGPLFALLAHERPRRSAEINTVAILYGLSAAPAPTSHRSTHLPPLGGGKIDEAGLSRHRLNVLIGCLLSILVVIGILIAQSFEVGDASRNAGFASGNLPSEKPPALRIPDAADDPAHDVYPSVLHRPDVAAFPGVPQETFKGKIAALLVRHEVIVRDCVYKNQQENFHTPRVGQGYKIGITINGSKGGYEVRVLAPLPRQSRTIACVKGGLDVRIREISPMPPLIGTIGSRHYTIP